MTTEEQDALAARLARKAVIARQLTDPLGRLGFRQTRVRVEREANARRAVFVLALGAFAAAFLAITGLSAPPDAAQTSSVPAISIPALQSLAPSDNQATQPVETRTSHVRTRSTS